MGTAKPGRALCWLAGAIFIGCGGGSGPRQIAGGGVSGGSIDGSLYAFVIDAETGIPIGGAQVFLGEGSTFTEHLTDETGFLHVEQKDLTGPVTVTAAADGYVHATWFGVAGNNVTIPLEPVDLPPPPQAALSGTISGWSGLGPPASDHMFAAMIDYSWTRSIDDRDNEIGQSLDPTDTNCYMFSNGLNQCAFTINSRVGDVAIYAPIIDIDTQGNLDPSDDSSALIGFAIARNITVEDGVDQSDLSLEMLPAGSLGSLSLIVPPPPSGLTDGVVLVQADLGNEGIIALAAVSLEDANAPVTVPNLEGPFDGSSVRLIALANETGPAEQPAVATVTRGIEDFAKAIDTGAWPDLPTNLSVTANEYSFVPTAAVIHGVELVDNSNDPVWNVALLDGRTSFVLPAVTNQPVDANALVVNAIDGDFQANDFSIEEILEDQVTLLASERFTLP